LINQKGLEYHKDISQTGTRALDFGCSLLYNDLMKHQDEE
jgi:hypothetical protein